MARFLNDEFWMTDRMNGKLYKKHLKAEQESHEKIGNCGSMMIGANGHRVEHLQHRLINYKYNNSSCYGYIREILFEMKIRAWDRKRGKDW